MLKKILIGCGILLLMCMIGCGLFVWGIFSVVQPPKGLELTVDSPSDVRVGDTFDLVVRAKNTNKTKSIKIGDVDLSNDYLKGFRIVATNPKPKSTMSTDIKIANLYSSTFDDTIPPGREHTYTFSLKAVKVGQYEGEVDIYEGMHSLTQFVQTYVAEQKSAATSSSSESKGETGFTVVMKSVDPARKIQVIREIRAIKPELGLKEAKDLVDNAPANVLIGANKEEAEKAREQLTKVGAEVEVREAMP